MFEALARTVAPIVRQGLRQRVGEDLLVAILDDVENALDHGFQSDLRHAVEALGHVSTNR
ncbi:hypothetical protein CKY47_29740 [Saccharothrix yanglingensis]|uniref:Uncharacterized protein n=1 Tax=Saccharothrix yanglingensis TaxID=659496 RepID=A0ABU0XA41_9PSEU|nr:hypothetical protein [Saccharothrix yanglingensis]